MLNVNDESRSICFVPDVNATVISSLPLVLPVVPSAFVDAEKARVERTSNVVKIRADFFL